MLAGCGDGGDDGGDEAAPANFVSAAPPSGSEIAANASITLTFDNAPADVTSSAGVATTAGKSVTVAGPLHPRSLEFDDYLGRRNPDAYLHCYCS